MMGKLREARRSSREVAVMHIVNAPNATELYSSKRSRELFFNKKFKRHTNTRTQEVTGRVKRGRGGARLPCGILVQAPGWKAVPGTGTRLTKESGSGRAGKRCAQMSEKPSRGETSQGSSPKAQTTETKRLATSNAHSQKQDFLSNVNTYVPQTST